MNEGIIKDGHKKDGGKQSFREASNFKSVSLNFKNESLDIEWSYLAIRKKKYLVIVVIAF